MSFISKSIFLQILLPHVFLLINLFIKNLIVRIGVLAIALMIFIASIMAIIFVPVSVFKKGNMIEIFVEDVCTKNEWAFLHVGLFICFLIINLWLLKKSVRGNLF